MTVTKVLLVDDEPSLLRIGELSLRKVGKWEVLLALSGTKALELAAMGQPDVILLDVMMPDMDGPTLLAKLRSSPDTAQIPVIFMTAKAQKDEVERYLGMGAAGVIAKPFDPIELPAEILKLLERHP